MAIQCLEGDSVWEAGESGKWSLELAEAACAQIENRPDSTFVEGCPNPTAFLLEHSDGFCSTVLNVKRLCLGFRILQRKLEVQ